MTKLALKQLTRTLVIWVSALAAILGMLLLMLMLSGYFQAKVPIEGTEHEVTLPANLQTATIASVKLPRSETSVGTIRSANEVALASKILAQVLEVRVKAGQAVKQGEVLVRLDDADLTSRLRQAESSHQSALAQAEQAAADLDRASRLIGKQAITQAEYDQALATDRSMKAEVQRTAQAIEETKIQLEYATIRAPFNAVVIDKRIEAGDTATPGRVLIDLYEPDRMQLVAVVRESLAVKLKVGDMLPVELESLGYQCEAAITEIVPQAETSSRSFTVKVTGPCPEGVYSGMFGRLFIPLDEEDVNIVPVSAIKRVGQLTLAEVVVDGNIQRRSIQVGRLFKQGFEVLSGLKPGEVVILNQTGSAS
jgi:RND family efflux transporter MFP subunit